MPYPITPDHVCISATDHDVSVRLLAHLLDLLTDSVITVTTIDNPDGITLTTVAHEPHHEPWHLYGAAFIDDGHIEPDVALPVIPLTTIRHIHIW